MRGAKHKPTQALDLFRIYLVLFPFALRFLFFCILRLVFPSLHGTLGVCIGLIPYYFTAEGAPLFLSYC